MRRALFVLIAFACVAAPLAAQRRPVHVPPPSAVLGFVPGTDRKLVDWETIVAYFRALEAASDRIVVREIGHSTGGAPFIVAFISSRANLARLPVLRDIQRRLSDPRLVPDSAAAERLIGRGKVFALITSDIHSTEVGGSLSPLDIAYRLASDASPEVTGILSNTVVMLVPSVNPDGVSIVARWYSQTLGTNAEGTSPPELYNRYTGHDDNRDWYAFTQIETRLVVDSLYDVWHPQVTLDLHQQGTTGSRLFIPPYLDPVEPNVDPLLVQGDNALGLAMAWRLTAEGFTGVAVNSLYDAWSPSRAFQHYHGAARTWTIGDIVRYQTAGTMAFLDQVAHNRARWMRDSRQVAVRAVHGWPGWPYAFVIPSAGQNPVAVATLLEIFRHAAVEVRAALAPFTIGREHFFPGTYVVPLRQPYAAFAKAMLERQSYPDLRQYPGGPPRRPYDVTAETLPLLLGVRVLAVADTLPIALSAPVAASPPVYRLASLTAGDAKPGAVRTGVYRSFVPAPDEGWTRWVFDTWGVSYESVGDSAVRAGNLGARFDALILPSQDPRAILSGLPDGSYPARYTGGLGPTGAQALAAFVDSGGTLIALNEACDFAIGALDLPVTDVLDELSPGDFYAPGSLLRLQLDPGDPLADGMPAQPAAWFESGPAFEVADPTRVRVVARFPADPADVLLSGWLLGAPRLAGKAALVEVRRGRGRVILFGFRPQYRGQSLATLPLLFNAIRSAQR